MVRWFQAIFSPWDFPSNILFTALGPQRKVIVQVLRVRSEETRLTSSSAGQLFYVGRASTLKSEKSALSGQIPSNASSPINSFQFRTWF